MQWRPLSTMHALLHALVVHGWTEGEVKRLMLVIVYCLHGIPFGCQQTNTSGFSDLMIDHGFGQGWREPVEICPSCAWAGLCRNIQD